ncbi:flagellin-like protein [Paramagnetospirillum caucaseum]|uniref:Flagellin n=1 Tax=Paramagnetospirillum caucaseum TaxID=1244869 RepID=M3ACN6_9PROT|nr:flagellin [Paramagnetospirillum caucaseum]EME70284.1 flagellin-like protein [Paramagnetospirillum caucaseum]
MSDVTLTSAVRSNLLALQSTQGLVNRTQGRLSTGLKVGSAIDDPVAYFQSKALSDRASDFQGKKDNIDQGVSSLSTALQGISGVSTLVKQLKGLALNAQSASSAQIGSLVQQFNALRSQLDNLALDTQYQGQNLVAGAGQTLTVSFSNLTGSTLEVTSVDVRVGATGLNISKAVTSNGGFQLNFQDASSVSLGEGVVRTTYAGTAVALTSGLYTFSYGSAVMSFTVYSAGSLTEQGTDFQAFTTTTAVANGDSFAFRVSTEANGDTFDITAGSVQNGNRLAIEYSGSASGGISAAAIAIGSTITVGFNGLTGSGLASGNYTFSYAGETLSFTVGSAGNTGTTFTTTDTFTNGVSSALSLTLGTAGGVGTGSLLVGNSTGSLTAATGKVRGVAFASGGDLTIAYGAQVSSRQTLTNVSGQYVLDSKLTGVVQGLVTKLDENLQTLRAHAQNLGTNVALLNTRLDFTKNYVDLLQSGSGKLTLADLNEEGANLLALQTRQQLGIQALSFAGQNEKSILSLFR